ncbi:MAG: DUF3054 family protein [Acidimicrobiia bacterium]|nr:DUF3054 family protein [Acidimicrobiia bacterium]
MRRALLVLDPLVVVAFVAIGRDTHDRTATLGGFAATVAPFLVALAVAVGVFRAWRDPLGPGTGLRVAALTVAGGLVLRRLVFGDGTAAAFVAVATVFLVGAMLSWRLVARRFAAHAGG